jgi:uncharacterized membrane protein YeaQ/YmgE (transglycosylase-associated protein family)
LRYIGPINHSGEKNMTYVYMAIIGFIVGLIARAILPGTQSLGIILTAVLGIAGSLLAGFAGKAMGWYTEGQPAGFIASVIGAIILLFIVGKLKGPST